MATQYFDATLPLLQRRLFRYAVSLRQCLLAARLIPLTNDVSVESLRPIAVADVLYRICTKAVVQRVDMNLLPHRLSVKSAKGVEPASHTPGAFL